MQTVPTSWSDVEAGLDGKEAGAEGLWVRCPERSAILFRSLENNLERSSGMRAPFQNLSLGPHHGRVDRHLLRADGRPVPSCSPPIRWNSPTSSCTRTGSQRLDARRVTTMPFNFRSLGSSRDESDSAVMDFTFLGGSMGSVVGEKITRATEARARGGSAADHRLRFGRGTHDGVGLG